MTSRLPVSLAEGPSSQAQQTPHSLSQAQQTPHSLLYRIFTSSSLHVDIVTKRLETIVLVHIHLKKKKKKKIVPFPPY